MIFHNVIQNSDEWHMLRLGKVTASKYGVIMANDGKAFGEPAKRYALQLALERLTGDRDEIGFSNEHTERGHEQEPIARMLYEELHFVTVSNGGFFDCGDYGVSPDGLVCDDGLIEVKSVIAPTHYDTLRRGKHDPAYHWQLVGLLDGTGRDWVDFTSYCAAFPYDQQLIIHRMDRDKIEPDIKRLHARRHEFISLVLDTIETIRSNA